GGTGDGEWPLFLEQFLEPFVGSTHHLHAVHVVCLAVRATVTIKIVAHVIGECTPTKYRGLIHIVPHTGYPGFYQLPEQPAPPFTHFFIGEVGKLATARPHIPFHEVIVAAAAEIVVFLP